MRTSGLMLLLVGLTGLAGCNPNVTPAPLVVGHVADLSRPDKAGDQAELGIRLALHDVKGAALTEALNNRSIQVRHTNTQGDINAYESEAVRLETINRSIAILGGYSSKEVMALDHVKVPILTFHGQPVSGASNQVFYLGMAPAKQGEVLAKAIAEKVKINKVVLVFDERRAESAPLVDAFHKTFHEARKDQKLDSGGILTVRFGKDADWSELMGRTRTPEPQAVLFAGSVNDFNAFHKAFRREFFQNEPTLIYAGNDGEQRLFDQVAEGKAAVLYATAFYADPASDKILAFIKAYHDAFDKDADVNAALAYDGFRMLVEAFKGTANQLTPDKVREELLRTKDFPGLTGPMTVTPERQVRRPLHVMRWENGAVMHVKTFAP
ncbi:MAG TPA: ABC transporter substrate-binding protein [Gemmataceae bacterium]|nr:ABC transporter substrate-binding protein [Gemmataceae bacterium]